MTGGGGSSIIHADLDAFYASVEQRDDPRLRGRPVIVGSGVVLAASYEARARGVRTAMGGRRARALCPDAVVVAPRFGAYAAASREVFAQFDATTPLVEPLSIDEAFLDVGGLRRLSGTAVEIGQDLRDRVCSEVGLPITVGIARTKFLAKVASTSAKPDGLLLVDPNHESEFLHPLPVGRLWGVGPATTEKLRRRGLETVGDVAGLGEPTLSAIVGPAAARHLHALANHRDPRRVETGRRRQSVGSQQALGRGHVSHEALESILFGIVDRVLRRLRAGSRLCRTVVLRLRFDDYTKATRSTSLIWPTDSNEAVRAAALELLAGERARIERDGITLIGLSVTNLTDATAVQLPLPFDTPGQSRRARALDTVLDDLSGRFGSGAVTRASLLTQRLTPEVPKIDD